jgi:hypothetical protein
LHLEHIDVDQCGSAICTIGFAKFMREGSPMQPPKTTDMTVAELLRRAEAEIQSIEVVVNATPDVTKQQRCLQRDLLEVLKTLEQARFSASYGISIADAGKLWATLPKPRQNSRASVH